MEEFTSHIPRIVFGKGKVRELAALVEPVGKKALLAIDPFLYRDSPKGQEILKQLQDRSLFVVPYWEISPDPPFRDVDKAGGIARENQCDCVIAVGGGSTMDFGKAVAVVARNPGSAWQYTRRKDHTPLVPGPATLPVVAVPTTAGTGSEATQYSVLSHPDLREKSTIVHDRIMPVLAVVDPEMTYSMPLRLTTFTGLDVLTHAAESYITLKATAFSRMFSLEALRRVGRYLRQAVANGNNERARGEMAWASTLGGIAIAHANPTLPHALGQAFGAYVGVPHGASVAALLPEIMRRSFSADLEGFAAIAVALDPSAEALPLYERAERSIFLVERLFGDLGFTVRLSDFGLKESDIGAITKIALTAFATSIGSHPKECAEEEITQIYRACL